MKHKPTIFVSSTCYDLSQIRKDIKDFIEDQLGFESKLSEYDSFPIDSNLKAVENCIQVVKNFADIFVLIVGGRYGQITENEKSVTNLEYNCAKAKGIPIYIFVATNIINMIPIWRDNPSGNFHSIVDTTKLFEFVETLRNVDKMWVNKYDSAQEIISALREQIAYLFSDCLYLKKQTQSLILTSKLLSLRGEALKLALEKPQLWEYRLFGMILKNGLIENIDLRRDMKYNIYFGEVKKEVSTVNDIIDWMLKRIDELSSISKLLDTLFNVAIQDALGLPGKPGDADSIVYVGNNVIEVYKRIINWDLKFKAISVPPEWENLIRKAPIIAETMIKDIENYTKFYNNELSDALVKLESDDAPKVLNLTFTLHKADLSEFNKEVAILINKYSS